MAAARRARPGGGHQALALAPTVGPARVVEALTAAWAAPATRVVLPPLLASRLMVLAVGFLGVVLVGYPDKSPPFRVSRNEMVNLPVRWDAGWYLGIVLNGTTSTPTRAPPRSRTSPSFPPIPWSSGR